MLSFKRSKPSLMAFVAVGAMTLVSCSNDRGGNNPIRRPKLKDSGVNPNNDGGTNPLDSGMNNNNGDASTNNPDANTFDSGIHPDGGTPPQDGGMMNNDAGQMSECAVDSDCTDPNLGMPKCLGLNADGTSFVDCAAATGGCGCFSGCDPWVSVANSGCQAGEACGRAGQASPVPGICLTDGGGGTQGQACTAQFMGTTYDGDSCNGSQNYLCHGADSLTPTGSCARLCDVNNAALCTSLDPNTQCFMPAPTETIGACLVPANDIGTACTGDGECQGGYCSQELGGQCSAHCGLTFTCPNANAVCVGSQNNQFAPLCARTCTPGAAGDTDCAGVNANLVCEDLGGGLALCLPRCTMDMDCPMATPTCNVGTGHCE